MGAVARRSSGVVQGDLALGDGEGDGAPERLLRHARWVRALAGQLIVDHALADDVAQETLLHALEQPPPQREWRRAWLATVARHVAASFGRSRQRRAARERRCAPHESLPSAHDVVAETLLHHELVGALLAQPEPYRTALLSHWFEGRKPAAIAREFGVPVETVRTRLKRGLELLRAELLRRRAGGVGGLIAFVALLDGSARAAAMQAIAAGSSVATGAATAAATGVAASIAAKFIGGVGGVVAMTMRMKLVAGVAVVVLASAALWIGTAQEGLPRPVREASSHTAVRYIADPAALDAGAALERDPAARRSADRTAEGATAPRGGIRGHVIDGRGAAVVGARVGLLAPLPREEFGAPHPPAIDFALREPSVLTAVDGSFELPTATLAEGASALFDVAATASGWLPAIWRAAKPTDEVVLVLRSGRRVGGVVRNLAGEPVAGATLRWRFEGRRRFVATAISGADGRYDFADVLMDRDDDTVVPGSAWFDARAVGFAPSTFLPDESFGLRADGRQEIDVWMVRGATVRGRVIDRETGAPLANAEIWLQPWDRRAGGVERRTTSASDGRFTLAGLPAWGVTPVGQNHPAPDRRRLGELRAIAPRRGVAIHPLDVLDDGAQLEVELALPRIGGVRGRVVDARGAPVAGVALDATGGPGNGRHDRSHLDGLPARATLTDAEGRYELLGLALSEGAGTQASLFGSLDQSSEVSLGQVVPQLVTLIADQIVVALDRRLEREAVVQVEVVDEFGAPVERAVVEIGVPSSRRFDHADGGTTDRAGRTALDVQSLLEELPAAALADGQLRVTAAGHATAIVPCAIAEGGAARVELAPERRLHGRLLDDDGAAGGGFVLALPAALLAAEELREQLRSNAFWRTEAAAHAVRVEVARELGRFVLRGLGAGPWHVAAMRGRDAKGSEWEVVVRADVAEGSEDLALPLPGCSEPLPWEDADASSMGTTASGAVVVQLRDAGSGHPVLRTRGVVLRRGEQRLMGRVRAPGRSDFVDVPSGSWRLQIDAPGFARVTRDVEVAAGGQVELAIALEPGLVAKGQIDLAALPAHRSASLFFQSEDGGGTVSGALARDGGYELPGLVAGRSYWRWLSCAESESRSSLWVAREGALAAADAARGGASEWLPAAVLVVRFTRREQLGRDATLVVFDGDDRVITVRQPVSEWGLERVVPAGTYRVELARPGHAVETRTITLPPSSSAPNPELRFLTD